MNRISMKLGLLFFIIVIVLEALLLLYLHEGMVEARVDEEINLLSARAVNHREVLQQSFTEETRAHVAQMETHSDTAVILTDAKRNVLETSNQTIDQTLYSLPAEAFPAQATKIKYFVLEKDWRDEEYLSVGSPIFIDNELKGYVIMFKSTKNVQHMIHALNEHYIFAVLLTLTITILASLIISKLVTSPILKIKKAAQLLSTGNFNVKLSTSRKDELGDLARTIELLAKDLQYMKQERNEFLAAVSHELRTPLTYIQGYANLLQKKGKTQEEQLEFAAIIKDESQRLTALIQQLFHLAKLDKNSFEIKKETFSLNNFILDIQRKLLPAFQEKKIDLKTKCEENILIQGDQQAMQQVLLNLLDNAMKYSEENSSVTVSIKIRKDLHIYVSDTGKGISADNLPFIFDKFYRVDSSRARNTGGFGLGLAITKELIEAHGGQLKVQSIENQGTTFEIIWKEWFYEKDSTSR